MGSSIPRYFKLLIKSHKTDGKRYFISGFEGWAACCLASPFQAVDQLFMKTFQPSLI
jgi:hypothetical protein